MALHAGEVQAPYSALRHIASAIWPNHDPARCWMVTYRAYYDASGSETDPSGVLVVFGLVAPERKWVRFEADWESMLRDERLPALHMKTLLADLAALHPGQDIHARANVLLERAARIIKYRLHKPVSVSIDLPSYRAADRDFVLQEGFGNGYGFTSALCMQRVQWWIEGRHNSDPCLHFFEEGDNGQDRLIEAIPRLPGYTCTVLPKYDRRTGIRVRAFEAADYVAWETRRILHDAAAGTRLRPIAHTLHRLLPFDDRHFTEPQLRTTCEMLGIPRRSSK